MELTARWKILEGSSMINVHSPDEISLGTAVKGGVDSFRTEASPRVQQAPGWANFRTVFCRIIASLVHSESASLLAAARNFKPAASYGTTGRRAPSPALPLQEED
jgi:hypothetical protein